MSTARSQRKSTTKRVARYGPSERAFRARLGKLSEEVTYLRHNRKTLPRVQMAVVKQTYPSMLDHALAMDKVRARALQFHGAMTEAALQENEHEAALMLVWLDCCDAILTRKAASA